MTPSPPRALLHAPRVKVAASLTAGAIGAVYLYGADPHQPGHWLPRCPFNFLTGLLCPLCGATRMAHDLMHGDLAAAFHDNALLLLACPFPLYLYARWVAEGVRGRVHRPVVGKRAQVVILGVALTWAVLRNAV
ncbi:DUF2752 domain-containing protein [Streptomyces sp. NPDC026673]|uniref:DUF2752 domain-containing protein n=1 Tax=Streptomyces sp. NPDC026673 TaxID=3155724 RepID=UPI0033F5182C